MKIVVENFNTPPTLGGQVRKITYSDGSTAYVFKKVNKHVLNASTRWQGFPLVNRNEPMTKEAYKRTLNRYFERLIELDLAKKKCLFLTLTIRNEKYNTYEKICDRFKDFTNKVRFNKRVDNSYVGVVRFIEVQQKGFFHVHCILVFDREPVKLTWKVLRRIWGWGYVKVKSVNYLIGLFDYLTNSKHSTENAGKFTRYPKGARVIYITPNLPKSKSENIELSFEECAALIQKKDYIGQIKIHKYFDIATQSVRSCIDKMVLIQIFQKEVAQIK